MVKNLSESRLQQTISFLLMLNKILILQKHLVAQCLKVNVFAFYGAIR